jgi:phosphopantothenoylcysteine decarboxylase/phosphopantothenate--cysteine ligase
MVDPGYGELACGVVGQGRLADLPEIMEEIRCALSPKDLAGLRVLVTSGPTREKWDDIRFISTPSSGRMGVSLAVRARQRGAKVVLVTGPTALPHPYGIRTIEVESTRDMQAAVLAELENVDVLVKAAAPGDFRPAQRVAGKVKKIGGTPPPIELARNPDILADIGQNRKGNRILVGFAAESENLLEYAREKLESKNLDLIVANQIGAPGAAFGAETNQVTLIDRSGQADALPLLPKDEVAGLIWDRIAALVKERRGGQPQAS